jgi:hypothetical protein
MNLWKILRIFQPRLLRRVAQLILYGLRPGVIHGGLEKYDPRNFENSCA